MAEEWERVMQYLDDWLLRARGLQIPVQSPQRLVSTTTDAMSYSPYCHHDGQSRDPSSHSPQNQHKQQSPSSGSWPRLPQLDLSAFQYTQAQSHQKKQLEDRVLQVQKQLPESLQSIWHRYILLDRDQILPGYLKIVQSYVTKQLQDILFVSFMYWQCQCAARRLETQGLPSDQQHGIYDHNDATTIPPNKNHMNNEAEVSNGIEFATRVQNRFNSVFEAFRLWYDAEMQANQTMLTTTYPTQTTSMEDKSDRNDDDKFFESHGLFQMRQQLLQQQLCSQFHGYFYVLSTCELRADGRTTPLSIYTSEATMFLLHLIQLLDTSWDMFTESPPYQTNVLVTLLQDIYGVQCACELQKRRSWFSAYYGQVIRPWDATLRTIDSNMSQRQRNRSDSLREQGRRLRFMDQQHLQRVQEWQAIHGQTQYTTNEYDRLNTQMSQLRNYAASYLECGLLVSMGTFFQEWFTRIHTDTPHVHPEWSQWLYKELFRSHTEESNQVLLYQPSLHSTIQAQVQSAAASSPTKALSSVAYATSVPVGTQYMATGSSTVYPYVTQQVSSPYTFPSSQSIQWPITTTKSTSVTTTMSNNNLQTQKMLHTHQEKGTTLSQGDKPITFRFRTPNKVTSSSQTQVSLVSTVTTAVTQSSDETMALSAGMNHSMSLMSPSTTTENTQGVSTSSLAQSKHQVPPIVENENKDELFEPETVPRTATIPTKAEEVNSSLPVPSPNNNLPKTLQSAATGSPTFRFV